MALVKTENTILSIRGRFGGVYFKKSPDGQHIQAMPRVWRYTRSPAQQGKWETHSPFLGFGIDGYSGSAALWLLALLGFYALGWAIFAAGYLFYKVGKEPKRLTGYCWYIHYALAFPECERPPFFKPPHSPSDLPNFMILFKGMSTYNEDPTTAPADYCTDYYWDGVPFNGKPTYGNDDRTWFLWWKDPMWVISPGVDYEPDGLTFYRVDIENHGKVTGYYRNPVTLKWANVYFGRPEEIDLPH